MQFTIRFEPTHHRFLIGVRMKAIAHEATPERLTALAETWMLHHDGLRKAHALQMRPFQQKEARLATAGVYSQSSSASELLRHIANFCKEIALALGCRYPEFDASIDNRTVEIL